MPKFQMWLRYFNQAKLAEEVNKARDQFWRPEKKRDFLKSPSWYYEQVGCHELPNAPLQLEVLWCFYFSRCLRGVPESSTWVSCAWLEECVRHLNSCMRCRGKEQILWQGGTQGELFRRMRAWRGKKPFHFWMNSVFSAHQNSIETAGAPSPRGSEIGWEQPWRSKSLEELWSG